MIRNKLLFTLLFLSSAVGLHAVNPNFVFILADDLGWADVACNFQETFYETPCIDRLAYQGVRFTQAYSSCPVCSPTRASILTGKYPSRVDITDWIPGDNPKNRPLIGPTDRNELAIQELTFAEKLKSAGYKTCYVGKWHLGGEGFLPENQGFDINIGGFEAGSPPGGYYVPYKNPRLPDGPEGEYLTDRLATEGIKFIENNRKIPFLLYLSFYAVHTPIQASKKHVENYREKFKKMNLPENLEKQEGAGRTRLVQSNTDYASMVTALDENVGRIVNALKLNGLDKNTWVFFTSDNGGLSTLRRGNAPTSNAGLRAGKGWCYEGGIRVPLIISGPGIKKKGLVSDFPVISMDFFPTIISLAGILPSWNDGIDLAPLLRKEKRPEPRNLMWHYPHYHGSGWKPGSAFRHGDWKLVVHYEDNRTELFNLKNDPFESKNMAGALPNKTEELRKLLNEWLKNTGSKMAERNNLP